MKIPKGASHRGPFSLTYYKEVKLTEVTWVTYEWNALHCVWEFPSQKSKPLPEEWKLKSTELNIFKFEGE